MKGKFLQKKEKSWGQAPLGLDAWHSSPKITKSKQLIFIEVKIDSGKGHSFHHHPNQEEIIYVLEGEIQQWLEEESRILKAGDSIFIAPGVVHATFNLSDHQAKFIAILSPCMGEEGYEVVNVFDQDCWAKLDPLINR